MSYVELGGKFEFTILARRHDFTNAPHLAGLEVEWDVYLPHPFDALSITGHATSKAAAVEELEAFIAEAQAALAALQALPEDAHDRD